jgi:hypothetical protein
MTQYARLATPVAALGLLLGLTASALPAGPAGADQTGQARQTPAGDDPDTKEYRNFRLSMDNVNKYVAASKALVKLTHDNPALERQLESQSDATTIEAAVKTTEKYPEVTAAIKNAGLSTRDFVVMSGTLMGAEMAVGMKKQGQIKAYPPSVSPENIVFVEQNWDKLNAMMKAVAQAAGPSSR